MELLSNVVVLSIEMMSADRAIVRTPPFGWAPPDAVLLSAAPPVLHPARTRATAVVTAAAAIRFRCLIVASSHLCTVGCVDLLGEVERVVL
jgi:hypothetical protein